MCYFDELENSEIIPKNIAISLGELLTQFFGINSDLKNEIHNLLSKNPYLWKTRPISPKLNYYAGCDVIYLPKIYNLFCKKCEEDSLKIKKINIENIFKECNKYLRYININKSIKNYNKMNLTVGTKLQGLIKNFQNFCVFVQLNIEMEKKNLKKEEEIYEKMVFPIIADESKANEILDKILQNKKAVIGIDTEAALEMSRFGILCLLQVNLKIINF